MLDFWFKMENYVNRKLECSKCLRPVENGDFVTLTRNLGIYHFTPYFLKSPRTREDCWQTAVNKVENKNGLTIRAEGFYFEGKIYDIIPVMEREKVRLTERSEEGFILEGMRIQARENELELIAKRAKLILDLNELKDN